MSAFFVILLFGVIKVIVQGAKLQKILEIKILFVDIF